MTNAKGIIPKRPLGKTGEMVSIYGLGGLYTPTKIELHKEAVEIVNRAIDLGVTYIDTACGYGAGASELNIGSVLKERRDEVFLATKSNDYTYDGTMALVRQSLRRLQTDHIDLYQHHFLGARAQLSDLQKDHCARQAFEQLREDGTIRFIGVTGHSSRVLADALEDYPYDCALIILNAAGREMQDPEDIDRFFRIAQERETGVIAMKVAGRGVLPQQGIGMDKLLPWVLSHPVSTTIVGISDIAHLEENVRVARAFEPMTKEEMDEVAAQATAASAKVPPRQRR